MRTKVLSWRESASLILVARTVFGSNSKYDYKVLCMKRSSQSGFMPDAYVFPGGAVSSTDHNLEWFKLYEKFGFSPKSFDELLPTDNVPPILDQSPADQNRLPKHLSIRICAIRETFEECGILLCRTPKNRPSKDSNWASFFGGHDMNEWQRKVNKDSQEFFNLCAKLEIYPDVWGLKTWGNWLTPPTKPQKFNTMFFLTSLNQIPPTRPDEKEVQELMWATPDQCMKQNSDEALALPVPQTYEIAKLQNFKALEGLTNFATNRCNNGCEVYWPYRIRTENGLFSILPGDDLYPENFDENRTVADYVQHLPDSNIQNRMWHKTEYISEIITKNLTPKCKHIGPQTKLSP